MSAVGSQVFEGSTPRAATLGGPADWQEYGPPACRCDGLVREHNRVDDSSSHAVKAGSASGPSNRMRFPLRYPKAERHRTPFARHIVTPNVTQGIA